MDSADRVAVMQVEVTTYYLEMTAAAELRPAPLPAADAALRRVAPPDWQVNRRMYQQVGAGYCWTDRLVWTESTWRNYVERPELETHVLEIAGAPAGYFELESQAGGSVELAYFGLLPAYIGRGLGAYLLSAAIERGWQRGAARVWVHTCSLDHQHALGNYLARGFRQYAAETSIKNLDRLPAGSRAQTQQ